MRGNISLRAVLVFSMAVMAVFALPAGAADLTWDTASGDAAVTDGTGTWLDPDKWTVDGGATNATWNSTTPDNAIIGSGGDGGNISLGTVTAGTVLLDNFTGTYSLKGGTLDQSGGITIGASAGNVNLPLSISGAGGITVNGAVRVNLRDGGKTFSGDLVINAGEVLDYQFDDLGTGNLNINGGVLVGYWGETMSRTLGSGPGQVQVPGGVSGFCGQGRNGSSVKFNNDDNYEVVWGSAEFNPSTLVLQSPWANYNGKMTWRNKLDLNGATRTIATNKDHGTEGLNGYSQMIGVIRNSDGNTPAGLTKTGLGNLFLTQANTYDGPTTIEEGLLRASSLADGGVASSIGASTNAASNLVLGNGATLLYVGGAASTDRAFTIGGSEATIDISGSGAVNFTGTASPAYGAVDQARTLNLTGTNAGSNMLAASIGDNGTGAVSIAKTGTNSWVLSGTNTYTGGTDANSGALVADTPAALPGYDSAGNVVFDGGTVGVILGNWTNAEVDTLLANATKTSGALGLDTTVSGNVTQPAIYTPATLGGLGIAKLGTGTLTLDQANTYTGPTTVMAGTLELAHADAVSSSSALVLNGGNVVLDTDVTLDALRFDKSGSTVSGSALNFTAGGSITVTPKNATGTITSAITGSPTVGIPDGTGYEGITFAPTSGTVTLGTCTVPYENGTGDKAGIRLGGTTIGNTVESVINTGGHYGRVTKEGTGTWTVGDIDNIGTLWLEGGTLVLNGQYFSKYAGMKAIPSGARLSGDFSYLQNDSRSGHFTVNSGGIVAPGDDGIWKATLSYNGSTEAISHFYDGSIYEWQIGGDDANGNPTTDTIHIARVDKARSLTVGDMILKILDAGGEVADGAQLAVFTYDDGVTIDMNGFANNFDTSELGASWSVDALSLVDGGEGIVYLTGLSNSMLGDADGDGDVDSADYIMVKRHFGGPPAAGTGGTGGDFNGNGTVDWEDLQTLMSGMNSGAAGATIPEPATLFIMLAAGLPALLKRRRSRG